MIVPEKKSNRFFSPNFTQYTIITVAVDRTKATFAAFLLKCLLGEKGEFGNIFFPNLMLNKCDSKQAWNGQSTYGQSKDKTHK